jgi:hypothetical protein
MALGEIMEFPDWKEDPDAYWDIYYERMDQNPDQVFEMWTLLLDEKINDDGSLESQDVCYETLQYADRDEARKSQERVFLDISQDPGVPCSAEFKSRRQAERMRSLLMKGEPGYYYNIKHRTECEVIETDAEAP